VSEGLKKILKISFPIALGLLIIFLFYRQLDAEAIKEFQNHFKKANYWWVFAAMVIAFISHVSRAMRWQMMIKSMGYEIGFLKSIYSVSVNYLVNLGIPRTGEIARCAVLSQYNGIPFDKSFGALVNERVVDVILLALTGLLTFIFQYDIFVSFIKEFLMPFIEEKQLFQNVSSIIIGLIILLLIFTFCVVLVMKGQFPLQAKFSKLFSGIKEGLLSITNLDKPWLFVFHSVFIWIMYWFMIYIVFFSIEGGSDLSPFVSLTVLFFGTFAFIAVSGGFGAYPVAMGLVVSLYGYEAILGNAVGWLLWGGQTILTIFLGALSFFMLSLEKKKELVK
jgi:uncharacterized protein (TIRG00374 family)